MSIKYVLPEVERFLATKGGRVLVISGKWGVGKTYAWNQYLAKSKQAGKFSASYYAYVSLFGIESLGELKAAIFQNTLSYEDIGKDADLETLGSVVKSSPSLWRKGGIIARFIPGLEGYFSNFEKVGFFWIKRQVICIDDLERKSEKLELRTVLGLISHLKEQRQCNVVLLLNDEKLADADEKEFREQLEKVADVNLKFLPTPKESTNIALDGSKSFHQNLGKRCQEIGLVNIRTIKKLESITQRLYEELQDFDVRILEQAVQSLVLFGFCKWQPEEAPPIELLQDPQGANIDFSEAFEEAANPDEEEADPKIAEWRSFLSGYGFNEMDEFDAAILSIVVAGHFDEELIQKEALRLQERLEARDGDQSFENAWELYHGSFDDNGTEIMEALANAVRNVPKSISPTNLSGTISVLKDLNWDGDIQSLIAAYIDGHSDKDAAFWDLDESTFGENVRDPDVRSAFMEKILSTQEDRDPKAILIDIGKSSGWSAADVEFLSRLTMEDFKSIFKSSNGTELRKVVKGSLMFRNVANPDPAMTAITTKAVEALQEIASESVLNKRRVAQKGVEIPTKANAGESL